MRTEKSTKDRVCKLLRAIEFGLGIILLSRKGNPMEDYNKRVTIFLKDNSGRELEY